MKLGFPTHIMVIAAYFWSAKENQQREHWVSLACKSVWLGCKETTHFITRVTCLSSGRRKDCLFPSKLWTCTPGNRSSRCRRHLRSLGWSVITKPQRSATSRGWLSPCSTANPRSHPSASGVTTVFPSHAEVRIRAQSTATVRAVPCDWQSRQSALELRRNLKRIWRPKDRRRTFPSPPHKVCSFTLTIDCLQDLKQLFKMHSSPRVDSPSLSLNQFAQTVIKHNSHVNAFNSSHPQLLNVELISHFPTPSQLKWLFIK